MAIIDSPANSGIKIPFLLLHVFFGMDVDIKFLGKCVLTCGGGGGGGDKYARLHGVISCGWRGCRT